jgi:HlyD family secretion protein
VVVVLIAVIALSRAFQKREGEPVQVGKVERRVKLESKVTASGEIRPVHLYNLTAEVPGRVEQIFVAEGQQVRVGQPLLRVDDTQIRETVRAAQAGVGQSQSDVENAQRAIDQARNSVQQARANMASAQAVLEQRKAELRLAQRQFTRVESTVEAGVAPKSQLDEARARLETAQAAVKSQEDQLRVLKEQVDVAQTGVARAEASLDGAKQRVAQTQAQVNQETDRLTKTTRNSPIDGVVSSMPVKVGEYALAGFTTTPLMTVADMSQINAEIKVDETDIADVQLNQTAMVKVDALGDVQIPGIVVEKAASAITRSGQTIAQSANTQEAKDFLVKIKLDPPQEIRDKLRPGMSATAEIITSSSENVMTIPLQAIVPREMPAGDQNGDKSAKKEIEGVFVLGSDNRAHFKPVVTGIKGQQEIELKSGLNEGEEIIIGPYKTLRTLKDDDQVKREERPAGEIKS